MDKKTYLIADKKFMLKDFDDYTHNEEVKIKKLLGIKDEGDENTVTINSNDNNVLLPLILESDEVPNLTEFDFNDTKSGMLNDIATDWIAARFFFTKDKENSFRNLLLKKIQQTGNTQASTEIQETLHQI